jgi:predicted tellurium resistance membrane protein TerC
MCSNVLIKTNGALYAIALLVALIIPEIADLLFAIDSILSVLAISLDYLLHQLYLQFLD